jgi:alkylation response protein AidB-like acyl-CoA dehydrogenase
MNFDLTEDQKMLVQTAASFVKKTSPVERLRRLRDDERGWEPAVWRQMGDLGWLGIPFPDELGGFGGRFIDAALVIEQLGATLVPEPYIPSVVLGGMAVLRAGDDAQRRRWLEPLIAGETSLALAWAERDGRYDPASVATRAERDGAGWRLSGEKVFVQNGHAADHLVVSARTGGAPRERDGVSLFVVERGAPGVALQPVKTIDGQRAAMLRLDGVAVGAEHALGPEGGAAAVLEGVLDLGAAAACAEGVGIAQAVLDMTVEYLKTREQFGVKIGVFQALQHRAVDMFVEVELCRSMGIMAGIRADDPDPVARQRAVSAAKAQLSAGGRFVVRQAIQLHGGIGCTDEHDVGLYFKRMEALAHLYGDEEAHVARFASLPSFSAGVEPAPSATRS